jgi:hypothetical protein
MEMLNWPGAELQPLAEIIMLSKRDSLPFILFTLSIRFYGSLETHSSFLHTSSFLLYFHRLQKTESLDTVPEVSGDLKKAVLEQRRCILLAVVGSASESSPSLERVLSDGFLGAVKVWLDQVLDGSVGK